MTEVVGEVPVAIIGAGVVGLAVAAAVSRRHEVLLLERHETFGQETSSRNSGVIHAGIYYPPGSLKGRLCVEGRRRLYELCQRFGVPHDRIGKLIVAADEAEAETLHDLARRGAANDVEGLRLLSRHELLAMEPNVEGAAALLSPQTGIVDQHALMSCFLAQAKRNGARAACGKDVVSLEPAGHSYLVTAREPAGESTFAARVVVNAAGLCSDAVAAMAGLNIDTCGYRLRYCLGEYFSLRQRRLVRRLVYPVPETAGLGIHLTPDLYGSLRLGPSARYVESVSYQVDECQKPVFVSAARRYLPWLEDEDVAPDFAGVRPKLQGPGEGFRDFVISHEASKGLPGIINLVGIESPGLTSAPAIAEMVAGMVDDILR